MLFLRAKIHDVFDPGTVVPAAVENHDFAGGGEMLCNVRIECRVFSRSEGAGNATSRKTRGLTRSVMALKLQLVAPSRPSNTDT